MSSHESVLKLLNLDVEHDLDDSKGGSSNTVGKRKQGNVSYRKKFTNSVFMLLYLIAKDANMSTLGAYAVATINMLQLISLTFKSADFHWNEDVRDWFYTKLEYVNFEFLQEMGGDVGLYTLLVTLSLVSLSAIICLYICYQFWMTGIVKHLWMLPPLRMTMRLLTTVLYVPVLSILLNAFKCSSLERLFVCGSTGHTAMLISIGVLLVCFVLFNCVVVLVDSTPSSNHALKQVHGRVDLAYLLCCALTSLIFSASSSKTILVFTSILSGAFCTGVYFVYLPFLRNDINRLFVGTNAGYLWCSICFGLAEIIGDRSDYGAVSALLLGWPVFVGASVLSTMVREQQFAKETPHVHMNHYRVELILRFKYLPSIENWAGIKNQYRKIIDTQFDKNPYLALHLANLFEFCGNNQLLAGQYVRRAKSMSNLQLDHKFFIFKYFKRQQEKTSGTNGALNYVAFTHHRQNAEKLILESISQVEELWKVLGTSNHTADDVFQAASKIYLQSNLAKSHLDQLIQISKSSRRAVLLYSVYTLEVLNDPVMARRLIKTAKTLVSGDDNVSVGGSDDSKVAILTISGDEHNIGVILESTESVSKVFGYPKSQLLGRSIDFLIPPPFCIGGLHSRMLHTYIEKTQTLVTIKRRVWGAHSKGHTFAMDIFTTPNQDEHGSLQFSGKCVIVEGEPEFVMVDEEGIIQFYSKGMVSDFGVRTTGENGSCHLSKFIPQINVFDFKKIVEEHKESQNGPIKVTHKINCTDEGLFTVTATPKCFGQLGSDLAVRLVLLHFEPPAYDDVESDEEDGDSQLAFPPNSVAKTDLLLSKDSNEGKLLREMLFTKEKSGKQQKFAPEPQLLDNASDYSGESDGESVSNSSVVSAGSKKIHGLHRIVEKRIQSEDTRLDRFRVQCFFTVGLFVLLAVVSLIIQQRNYESYHETVSQIYLSSKRAYSIIILHLAMLHHLSFVVPKDANGDFLFEEGEFLSNFLPGLIKQHTDLLAELHIELMASIEDYSETLQPKSFFLEQGKIMETIDGFHFKAASLEQSILKVTTHSRAFLDEEQNVCGLSCRSILNNAPYDLLDLSMEGTRLYYEISKEKLEVTVILPYIIFGVSCFLVLVIIMVQIIPLILEIRRTKQSMTYALSKVPKNLVKSLRKRTHAKTSFARQTMEEINTGVSTIKLQNRKKILESLTGEGEEDHQTPQVHTRKPTVARPTLPPMQVTGSGSQKTTKRLKNEAKVAPVGGKTHGVVYFGDKNRKNRRLSCLKRRRHLGSCMFTFLKLCVPLQFLVLYFWYLVMMSYDIQHTVSMYTASIYFTGTRWSTIQRLHASIESDGVWDDQTWHRAYREPEKYDENKLGRKYLNEVKNLTESIIYGNDHDDTLKLEKSSHPHLFELEYEQACIVDLCSDPSFQDDTLLSDLKHGVNVAVERLVDRAENLFRDDQGFEGDVLPFETMHALSSAIEEQISSLSYEEALVTHAAIEQTILFSFIFLLLCSFTFTTIYKIFKRINNELKHAQYILLMLPIEVFKIPEMKKLVDEYT